MLWQNALARPVLCALPLTALLADVAIGQEVLPLRRIDLRAKWVGPQVNGKTPFTHRLVDAGSGEPIEGAMAFIIDERNVPLRGEMWAEEYANADALGFVSLLSESESPMWVFAEAPGYHIQCIQNDFVSPLGVAVDIPFVVRNYLGEPTAGAKIGFCIGCGHTPDVRVAFTDSTGHGVVRGPVTGFTECAVDAYDIRDIYLETSGLELLYKELPRWLPGATPVEITCDGAPDLVGRVVDRDGNPRSGVVVGQTLHRGPYTTTDDKGTFRLVSPEGDDHSKVWLGLRENTRASFILPPSRAIDLCVSPGPPTVPVEVRIVESESGRPLTALGVNAVPTLAYRNSNVASSTDAQGVATLKLPVGQAVVWFSKLENAEGHTVYCDLAEHVIDVLPVVAGTVTQRVDLPARLNELIRVRYVLPENDDRLDTEFAFQGRIFLSTSRGRREVELNSDGLGIVSVPSEKPSMLMANAWPPQPLLRLEPSKLPAGIVELKGPPVPELRLQAVDSLGRPIEIVNQWGEPDAWDLGRHSKWIRAFPTDHKLRPRTLLCPAPAAGEHMFDLGRVKFTPWADAPLRVRMPDDEGVGAHLTLVRPGVAERLELWPDRSGFEDTARASGWAAWHGMGPQSGDWALVDITYESDWQLDPAPEYLRHRERLRGAGPWQIEIPTGEVEFEIVDQQGRAVPRLSVYVRDQHFDVTGSLRLRHVPPAPLDFVFVHPDHGSGVGTVHLKDGEKRRLRVVL